MKNLQTAHVTHEGKRRKNNEDCYIIRSDLGFYAVADGLGGHQSGEVASFVSCAKFVELLEKIKNPTKEDLEGILKEVDNYVISLAGTFEINYENGCGMGTTFTGLLFSEKIFLIHIGDSRCYNYRDGQLIRISRDHQDGWGYLITSLGLDINLDSYLSYVTEIEDISGRWLLATDGLEELSEKEIEECMNLPLEECKKELLKRTLDKGAKDNVTLILLE